MPIKPLPKLTGYKVIQDDPTGQTVVVSQDSVLTYGQVDAWSKDIGGGQRKLELTINGWTSKFIFRDLRTLSVFLLAEGVILIPDGDYLKVLGAEYLKLELSSGGWVATTYTLSAGALN